MSENQPSLQPGSVQPKSPEISSWQTAYEKTMWELDQEKLLTLIHATEQALILRWLELTDEPKHKAERETMDDACHDLWRIKVRKLGWPAPRGL